MGRRRGQQNHRLPSMPEGDERDDAIRRLAGKMATVRDVERLLQAYDARYVTPLRERVIWLDMPWYRRAWHRSGLDERWSTLKHRVSRWWYARKWSRLEKEEG